MFQRWRLPDFSPGVPSEVTRRRPDVAAAVARLHAATAPIGLAVADLYPCITLGASFGLESVEAGKFGEWAAVSDRGDRASTCRWSITGAGAPDARHEQ